MKPSKEKSLVQLRKSLDSIGPIGNLDRFSPDHEKWEQSARSAIRFVFGEGSQYLKDFDSALRPYSNENKLYSISKADAFRKITPKLTSLFELMIEEVQDYWEQDAAGSEPGQTSKGTSASAQRKNVFIIHGHDSGAKEELARFLSKLDLNPIILHEQANEGRAVIEKFEKHATVSYAIALITPDDVGGANGGPLRSRPRQNVLFEFGYFMGKLGRQFVCGLIKGEVEIPSDYSGVLYINFDSAGAWKLHLVRELKAAELEVDANAVL